MKLSHLFAAAALSLPVSAMADYSYSYLEIGYRSVELSSDEGSGFDLEMNFLLGDIFYVTTNIDEVEYDNDLHMDRFGLGIGAHYDGFYNTSLYAELTYEDLEFDLPGAPDMDDKGWGYEIGARYQLNEDWEFRMAGDFAVYEDKTLDLESQAFIASAVYNISPNYAVVGEYHNGEIEATATGQGLEEQTLRIGLRFQF